MEVYLTKKNSNGKKVFWSGTVLQNTLTVSYGAVGGKVVTKTNTYTSGKNLGRSNETSPHDQACFELNRDAIKKVESGYVQERGEPLVYNTKVKSLVVSSAPEVQTAQVANKHLKKISGVTLYAQYKYDGFRCTYDVVEKKLYSRAKKEFKSLPYLVEQLSKKFNTSNFPYRYLDGELYSSTLSFEEISSIVASKKNTPSLEKQKQVSFYCFDAFSVGCVDKFSLRYSNVKKHKETKFFLVAPTWKLQPQTYVDESLPELQEELNRAESQGYEGLMLRLDGVYEQKRSFNIYKLKSSYDTEGVCVRFCSEEHNEGVLGSLVFRLNNGVEVEARPALSNEEKATLWRNKNKYVGRVGVIKYQEQTSAGSLRFPRFTGRWRPQLDLANS